MAEDDWTKFVTFVSVPVGRRGGWGKGESVEGPLAYRPLLSAIDEGASLFALEAQQSDDPFAGGEGHAFPTCWSVIGVVRALLFVVLVVGRLVVGFGVWVVPWVDGCGGMWLTIGVVGLDWGWGRAVLLPRSAGGVVAVAVIIIFCLPFYVECPG